MVMSPVNLCGWTERRVAKPPVDIVSVNQAHVKLEYGQKGIHTLGYLLALTVSVAP